MPFSENLPDAEGPMLSGDSKVLYFYTKIHREALKEAHGYNIQIPQTDLSNLNKEAISYLPSIKTNTKTKKKADALFKIVQKNNDEFSNGKIMIFDTAKKCKFDESKNENWKFPKEVSFQIAKKSEMGSNEITNLKSNIVTLSKINRDVFSQLVDKIPPITFDDVFNKKIQCGLRKIMNEIVEEDVFGDSVTIDPIEAILYVSSPKSGDSVKIIGYPR